MPLPLTRVAGIVRSSGSSGRTLIPVLIRWRPELIGQELREGVHLSGRAPLGQVQRVDATVLMRRREMAPDICLPIRQHRLQSTLSQIAADEEEADELGIENPDVKLLSSSRQFHRPDP
jgi:hypothetical protein